MTKKILSILFCIIIIFTFSACSKKGADARLVLPIDKEPTYLDPQIISDEGARLIMRNCFEGLFVFNENSELVPAGCESYSVSSDGLTYTFALRQNAFWRVSTLAGALLGDDYKTSFDNRVTADDYVFALRRAVSPETICPFAHLFFNIKNAKQINDGKLSKKELGVSSDGDYTLKIKLEKKDCDLLYALSSSAALPCNRTFFEATKGRYGLNTSNLIFNGPFYISNWAEGTSISLRKNAFYHNRDGETDEVFPASVYVSFNRERSTRLKKLEDETYHIAAISKSRAEKAQSGKNVHVKEIGNSISSIIFNCKNEFTSNTDLRKAIAYSIDRSILKGEAASVIPSSMILNSAPIEKSIFEAPIKHNESKAKEKFNSALNRLEISKITLSILCDESRENFARELIRSMQSAFGIRFTINVEPVDSLTFSSRIKQGDFQIALYTMKFNSTLAKSALTAFMSDSQNNPCKYENGTFDALAQSIFLAGNKTATANALKTARRHLIDNAVLIPLERESSRLGIFKKASGFGFSPCADVVFFKDVLN